jgi:AcrR family transcriptional regulator
MSARHVKSSGQRRAYHSPRRAQQALATRRRIRTAAQELFLSRGYTATSINTIASAAGVALRTIFLAFPSKAAILSEIIQVAVRGDDQQVPVSGRAPWQTMRSLPAAELLADFASGTATILARTAPLLELGEIAADQDSELAAFRDRGHANMRSDFRELAAALAGQGGLREGLSTQAAADIIYALANHDVYLRLCRECRWTHDDYTNWLTATLHAALLNQAAYPAASNPIARRRQRHRPV